MPIVKELTAEAMMKEHTIVDSFNATKRGSPSFPFGSSTRPPLNEAEDTPGAGTYNIKTTMMGNMPDSKIRTTPAYSLRGREKFGNPMDRAEDPALNKQPGPGWYTPKQVNPNERDFPKHSFPKSSWIQEKTRLAPGPGAYRLNSSVGKQVLSTRANNQPIGFGNGDRPPLLPPTGSDVGPGEYGSGVPACEKQVDSRKVTSGFVKFGKDARSKDASPSHKDELISAPGPGTYRLPSGICGGGAAYPFRAAPKARMAGREKFGSPF